MNVPLHTRPARSPSPPGCATDLVFLVLMASFGELGASREHELPTELVTCLTRVDIRQKLKSPRHIRLLKLYPPGWPAVSDRIMYGQVPEIRSHVFQASLDDLVTSGRPAYAAPSYTWGDPVPTRKLLCGNRVVGITSNIYEALMFVRFADRPRLLWSVAKSHRTTCHDRHSMLCLVSHTSHGY